MEALLHYELERQKFLLFVFKNPGKLGIGPQISRLPWTAENVFSIILAVFRLQLLNTLDRLINQKYCPDYKSNKTDNIIAALKLQWHQIDPIN